jgi:hypothetical protein
LYSEDLRVDAEIIAEVLSLLPRFVLVVRLQQEPHLLVAVTDAGVKPIAFLQAWLIGQRFIDRYRITHSRYLSQYTLTSHLNWDLSALLRLRVPDTRTQVAGFECGDYQQKLFEGHPDLPESTLAKQKSVQVENFVVHDRRKARNGGGDWKFSHIGRIACFICKPEMLSRWLAPD